MKSPFGGFFVALVQTLKEGRLTLEGIDGSAYNLAGEQIKPPRATSTLKRVLSSGADLASQEEFIHRRLSESQAQDVVDIAVDVFGSSIRLDSATI